MYEDKQYVNNSSLSRCSERVQHCVTAFKSFVMPMKNLGHRKRARARASSRLYDYEELPSYLRVKGQPRENAVNNKDESPRSMMNATPDK